ncbi:MAG: P-loop NTPase [Candidatus Poribacteria bacterium]|nr:P-loop NTPase [Candidatus Poribacteria bacterium]
MNVENGEEAASETKPKKTLITVHSQKGGVGKTLIALYLARRFAEPTMTHGGELRTVLIDADLTGTSLADVLELEAPKKSSGFHDVNRTIDLLREHGKQADADWQKASSFAMLNRFLFCNPWEYRRLFGPNKLGDAFRLRQLLWRWNPSVSDEIDASPNLERFRVLPSSGFSKDLSDCIPHIYKEDLTGYLEMRMTDLIWALWRGKGVKEYDVVVIDTPPILQGISRVALQLHRALEERFEEQIDITHRAVFISSPDAQDVVGLSRGLDLLLRDNLLNLNWVQLMVNRVPDTQIDYETPTGEVETYNLGDTAQTKQFYHECVKERYQFRSEPFKEGSEAFFTSENNVITIRYDEELAESFITQRMKFGSIDILDHAIVTPVLKGR